MKKHSIKKSTSIFLHGCKVYKRKKSQLSLEKQKEFEVALERLQVAIKKCDKVLATKYSLEIEAMLNAHLPISKYLRTFQSFAMLSIALFFAVVIRQTCFELMEVPTGSMRPAFRESDRLIVSKGHFGINVPLTPKHLTFSPDEMKRGGTVVLTSENMDVEGKDTKIFFVIPAVKKFLKRTIGLPEDTLYFYGGKIYGVDKDGNDISSNLQQDLLSHLEHIPYISIAGRSPNNNYQSHSRIQSIDIVQNHQNIARLASNFNGVVSGKMLVDGADDIHELWGMGNYAMTKIVPKKSLAFSKEGSLIASNYSDVDYFLEITHHSSIHGAREFYDYNGVRKPTPGKEISYLPLNNALLERIWDNLYTSRFNTKRGYLERFGQKYNSAALLRDRPKIKGGLEDGCYEFFDGIAYKVKGQFNPFGLIPSLSIPQKVSDDSPFANFSVDKCVTMYNMGIEQSKFRINGAHLGLAPARYGYFRDGDFFLMGKNIIGKNETVLKEFVLSEKKMEKENTHYTPFIDNGAPLLSDGSIDVSLIKKLGLFVPKKSYYVLGDNHAQSGDSREFGFVPEDNIRGITTFILWGPGGRFGFPLQVYYKWFTIHKVIVWSLLFAGIFTYYYLERRRRKILTSTPLATLLEQINKDPLWKF